MKIKIMFATFALSNVILAQTPYWKLGGNPLPGPADGVGTTNNFIGTNTSNNTFLKIGVQGSQDIFIDNDNSKLLPADASGRLHGGHWIGMGRVFTPTNGPGNWNFFNPKAHLHIDGGNNTNLFASFGGGLRPWMNTGTLYTENTDAMYVGLKSISNNFSYAVINWSDDAYGGNAGTDFLSFSFTGGPSTLQQSTDGIELGRFNPTQGRGTLGVGNFQFLGASTEPVRRLEILDADPATGSNSNTPQLRTTYTYNTTPTQGIFTEFQTTSLGDMYFNTRANGNARRFGFHDNTPGNTVEITANGSSPLATAPNGSSGLRFTNMTSANTPQANPGNGVLSVNATGDVIYVPGGGAGIANNGVSVNAGVVQLGVPCSTNLLGIAANALTTDRVVANRNQNFWFASLNTETGGVGVGGQPNINAFCNTGNTFEISANSKNTQYGIAGSGLRFTKLTSASATIPNGTFGVNSSKVLTVDGDGDVVLTDMNNTGLGNICGATNLNPLTNNWEIPMANNSYIFSGQAANDNVGIGTICAPVAKFQVQDNSGAIAPSVIGYKATSAFVTTHSNGLSASIIGFNNSTIVNSTAGYFQGNPASKVNAIIVPQNGGNVGLGTTTPAVQLHVVGGGGVEINRGNLLVDTGLTTLKNPGGNALNVDGNVGVAGNVYIFGDISGSGFNTYVSDINFKTNIDTINNASVIIKLLKPKTYYFDTTDIHGFNFNSKKQFGFIAQDVETILPELVSNHLKSAVLDASGTIITPATNYKALNYNGFFALLVRGMQQQQTKIDSLVSKTNKQDSINNSVQQQLTNLTNLINGCCSNLSARTSTNAAATTLNQIDVELSDKDVIILNQNVPNPFAEQTTITYNVPVSVSKAQIIFFNNLGQVIQTVDIKTRGTGKVNVFASDLTSGLYNYSLIADGKVIDSKKMVRE